MGVRPQEGGHCRVELEEFTETHYSQCYIPILTCTFVNPQNSMQSLMHGCIFLGRGSVILIRLSQGCVAPKGKEPLLQVHLPVHTLVSTMRVSQLLIIP